jgi:hypothetical protein
VAGWSAQFWVDEFPIGGPLELTNVKSDTSTKVQEASGVDLSYIEILEAWDFSVFLTLEAAVDTAGDIVIEFWLHAGSSSVLHTLTWPVVVGHNDETWSFPLTIPAGYFQVVAGAGTSATGVFDIRDFVTLTEVGPPTVLGRWWLGVAGWG